MYFTLDVNNPIYFYIGVGLAIITFIYIAKTEKE